MPRKTVRLLLFVLIAAGSLAAQPYINYRGVANAASLAPQGLPGGGIARGSVFTIVGRNFGPAQPQVASTLPPDNERAGVSVQVIHGGVTLAAIATYVSASRVSAIMPLNALLGKAAIRVRFNNRTSNAASINVVESAFGIYTINGLGFGAGIIRDVVSEAGNTTAVTARLGQTLILSGTGLGVEPTEPVEIFVGGKLAAASHSGSAAGVDGIAFDVRADATQGCYVPVQVCTRGATMSNAATIAIDPGRQSLLGSHLTRSARRSVRAAASGSSRHNALTSSSTCKSKPNRLSPTRSMSRCTRAKVATYGSIPQPHCRRWGPALSTEAQPPPALATCSVAGSSRPLPRRRGRRPTFGSGGAADCAPPRARHVYLQRAARPAAGLPGARPLFFNFPGIFNFLIPGGADVQTAQAQFETTEPVRWTNREQLAVLDRAVGLPLNWTGGDPENDVVLIVLLSNNDAANSTGLGLCVAPPGDGSFVVPPQILASLPATASNAVRIPGWVFLGSTRARNPVRFSAPGLDAGFIVPSLAGGNIGDRPMRFRRWLCLGALFMYVLCTAACTSCDSDFGTGYFHWRGKVWVITYNKDVGASPVGVRTPDGKYVYPDDSKLPFRFEDGGWNRH